VHQYLTNRWIGTFYPSGAQARQPKYDHRPKGNDGKAKVQWHLSHTELIDKFR